MDALVDVKHIADGGVVYYHPNWLKDDDRLLERLVDSVPWKQEKLRNGKKFPRLTAYYADPGVNYSYSGVTHEALPWTPELLEVKQRIQYVGSLWHKEWGNPHGDFNSLLLNYYRDGNDSIGWHSDAEPELGDNPMIASLSLGAPREFNLRHMKTKETLYYILQNGSLLFMAGASQHHWMHCAPKMGSKVGPRINLTFRKIVK